MSDEREGLRERIAQAPEPVAWRERRHAPVAIARAICEHLGITWDDVDSGNMAAAILGSDYSGRYSLEGGVTSPSKLRETADALATLLEAAGIER
jgi:hypothetical protein